MPGLQFSAQVLCLESASDSCGSSLKSRSSPSPGHLLELIQSHESKSPVAMVQSKSKSRLISLRFQTVVTRHSVSLV